MKMKTIVTNDDAKGADTQEKQQINAKKNKLTDLFFFDREKEKN